MLRRCHAARRRSRPSKIVPEGYLYLHYTAEALAVDRARPVDPEEGNCQSSCRSVRPTNSLPKGKLATRWPRSIPLPHRHLRSASQGQLSRHRRVEFACPLCSTGPGGNRLVVVGRKVNPTPSVICDGQHNAISQHDGRGRSPIPLISRALARPCGSRSRGAEPTYSGAGRRRLDQPVRRRNAVRLAAQRRTRTGWSGTARSATGLGDQGFFDERRASSLITGAARRVQRRP